jgi:hypothetical protein
MFSVVMNRSVDGRRIIFFKNIESREEATTIAHNEAARMRRESDWHVIEVGARWPVSNANMEPIGTMEIVDTQ